MATKKQNTTTPLETVPLETLVLEATDTEVLPETLREPAVTVVAATPVRPRIRWGAVVWGLIVTAIAATVMWINTSSQRHADFSTWLGGLTPTALWLIALLALGVFVLLVALLSLVRRAQRR